MASLTREQAETLAQFATWCDQRANSVDRRRTNRILNAALAASWRFAAAAGRLYVQQHS